CVGSGARRPARASPSRRGRGAAMAGVPWGGEGKQGGAGAPPRGPAPPPPPARPPDLRQHHGVETPEHVELQFELAGVGSRAAAGILDLFLLFLGSLLVAAVGSALDLDTALGSWFGAFLILLYSFSFFLYYTVFEGLGNG